MRFEWKSSEPALTRSLQQDGLGLTAANASSITVEQSNTEYMFEFHHSGHHGDANNKYVYVRMNGDKSFNLPRYSLSNGLRLGNKGYVSTKANADVLAVLGNANNRNVLSIAWTNVYS